MRVAAVLNEFLIHDSGTGVTPKNAVLFDVVTGELLMPVGDDDIEPPPTESVSADAAPSATHIEESSSQLELGMRADPKICPIFKQPYDEMGQRTWEAVLRASNNHNAEIPHGLDSATLRDKSYPKGLMDHPGYLLDLDEHMNDFEFREYLLNYYGIPHEADVWLEHRRGNDPEDVLAHEHNWFSHFCLSLIHI